MVEGICDQQRSSSYICILWETSLLDEWIRMYRCPIDGRFWSEFEDAHTNLRHCCLHIYKDGFSHDVVNIWACRWLLIFLPYQYYWQSQLQNVLEKCFKQKSAMMIMREKQQSRITVWFFDVLYMMLTRAEILWSVKGFMKNFSNIH